MKNVKRSDVGEHVWFGVMRSMAPWIVLWEDVFLCPSITTRRNIVVLRWQLIRSIQPVAACARLIPKSLRIVALILCHESPRLPASIVLVVLQIPQYRAPCHKNILQCSFQWYHRPRMLLRRSHAFRPALLLVLRLLVGEAFPGAVQCQN